MIQTTVTLLAWHLVYGDSTPSHSAECALGDTFVMLLLNDFVFGKWLINMYVTLTFIELDVVQVCFPCKN